MSWINNTMHHDCFDQDFSDAILLTVNSRLSRHLHTTYMKHKRAASQSWETPEILPLTSWMIEQFHIHNTAGKILLTDFHAQCIWEKIITESDNSPDLLQPIQTAQLVAQAWRFLTEWSVPLASLEHYQSQQEVCYLLQWIEKFQAHCLANHFITSAELPKILTEIDQQTPLTITKQIMLVGFDDLTPSLQTLFNQLQKRISVSSLTLKIPTATASRVFLPDNEAELTTMAQWAKERWLSDPNQQIACIIPDLQKQRALVRRIFTQVFCLENLLPSTTKTQKPFNISAGQSLDQHDMIKIALHLLQWSKHALPIDDMAFILQSPYLCQNEIESSMGAMIDAALREKNLRWVQPSDIFEVISSLQGGYTESTWLSRLRKWLSCQPNLKSRQAPSQWAQHFTQMLSAIKWPGQHTQDSVTFQYLERFKKLLHTFSQLDLIFKTIDYKKALTLLINLTKQTIFQPKSHNEPIQIMGVLEASGLTFDAAWIMGLHNGVWPAPTKPNPFIPFPIQQSYQLPHATAARELHFCQQVTARLKTCAQEVIFSAPLKSGDQALHPTQLIDDIPEIAASSLPISTHDRLATSYQHNQLEQFTDNIAPIVTHPSRMRGGSQILKLQATCPFKAFATIRLNAKALHEPDIGIHSALRGTFIHQVLYLIWGEISDQTELNKLSDHDLSALIDKAISAASSDFMTEMIKQKNHFFWELENKRIKKLITDWLNLEKSRPYFRVTQRETPAHIHIQQLPLKLRIDRVDQLADGSYLLIDYKTGTNNIASWLQEKPTDPQLPLYASFTKTTDQTNYTGVAFAEIRSGSLTFKGLVSETHLYAESPVPGLNPIHRTKNKLGIYQWQGLQNHWQTSLTELATNFCQGIATVEPINKQACQFCDLQPLCRI